MFQIFSQFRVLFNAIQISLDLNSTTITTLCGSLVGTARLQLPNNATDNSSTIGSMLNNAITDGNLSEVNLYNITRATVTGEFIFPLEFNERNAISISRSGTREQSVPGGKI